MSGGQNSPTKTQVALRKQEALDLRIKGLSFRAIAAEMGITEGRVHQLVSGALQELKAMSQEDAEALRQIECERLDAALVVAMEKLDEGSLQAIDRIIKISERRSKLLGIEAPIQQQVKLETEKQLSQTLEALKARMPEDAFQSLINALVSLNSSEIPATGES